MKSLLADKRAKIVVVDPSGSARTMMADTMRQALGFEQVEGRASVSDVIKHLEAETADWIILGSIQTDQAINGMHLLKICTETSILKNTRVSFFLDSEEKYVLHTAFELGLLSWHQKPFTKDSFGDEMKKFISLLESYQWNETLTAAHQLRDELKTAKSHKDLLNFERSVVEVFPGNMALLISLAEAQHLSGKTDQAKATLSQAKLVEPSLGDKINDVCKQLFGEPLSQPSAAADGSINVLNVKKVVVIDSDDAVRKGVSETMKSLGVAEISDFSDGEAAWKFLEKSGEPDLIILEWKIPRLSAPLLIQRIRHQGYLNVPLVVQSSLLKSDDMPIAREIGIANIVAKPFNKATFMPAVVWTIQQERQPTEHAVIERKIRTALRLRKLDEAAALRAQLASDPSVAPWRQRIMDGEFAYHTGDYQKARDLAGEALKLSGGESIHVLNLLGKTFMRLRNHDAALKCFSKAQELSPNNIERLCNMAESQTELGNHAAAEASLGAAKDIDPDNKVVAEAHARVAIAKGDVNAARTFLAGLDSLDSLVAYMNNKAVAYAKCGHIAEATGLYKRTIQSLPDDKPEYKAIVSYNLALAQAREGELEAAMAKLSQILKMNPTKIHRRAQSLHDRIKMAINSGQEFKLRIGTEDSTKFSPSGSNSPASNTMDAQGPLASPAVEQEQAAPVIAQVEARRGDLCCYRLYANTEQQDARVASLLAKPPRFTRRQAISRDEAMGVERLRKESA